MVNAQMLQHYVVARILSTTWRLNEETAINASCAMNLDAQLALAPRRLSRSSWHLCCLLAYHLTSHGCATSQKAYALTLINGDG